MNYYSKLKALWCLFVGREKKVDALVYPPLWGVPHKGEGILSPHLHTHEYLSDTISKSGEYARMMFSAESWAVECFGDHLIFLGKRQMGKINCEMVGKIFL